MLQRIFCLSRACVCVQLKEKLLKVTSPVARMESDDDQTRFLTGLPSYAVFASLFQWWYQPVNWLWIASW